MLETIPKKRGRPPIPLKKRLTTQFGLRFNPDEMKQITKGAKSCGMDPTKWAREVLLGRLPSHQKQTALKLAKRLQSKSARPDKDLTPDSIWSGFLEYYHQCSKLPWDDSANAINNQQINSSMLLSDLFDGFKRLSSCIRQVALRRCDKEAVEVLLDFCIKGCEILETPDLRNIISPIAAQQLYFPVLVSSRKPLNKRINDFIADLGLGNKVRGMSLKARWQNDVFSLYAADVIEHVERLVDGWKSGRIRIPTNGGNGFTLPKSKLNIQHKVYLAILEKFVDANRLSRKTTKKIRDEAWQVVDHVIIGRRDIQDSLKSKYLGMNVYWEDYFEDESLQRKVSDTCASGKRGKNPEIKKQMKEKFLTMFV